MSGYPYKGPPKKNLGQRLERDTTLNELQVNQQFRVPYISSTSLPLLFLQMQEEV